MKKTNQSGIIVALSVSANKGIPKSNIESVVIKDNFGIVGDAHAGTEKQISFLSFESITDFCNKGVDVKPGYFAENITTMGIDYKNIIIGDKILIGETVLLEITHKGKTCHNRCWIYSTVGDCIMPKEGVFAKVLRGGSIEKGESINLI